MAKQVKEVRIIGRYALKNGAIAYRVENGGGKQYCCTLNNSKWTCMDDTEQCKGQRSSKTHTCYHIAYCMTHENEYYKDGVLIEAPEIATESTPDVDLSDEEAKLVRWTAEEIAKQREVKREMAMESASIAKRSDILLPPRLVSTPTPVAVGRDWMLDLRR